MMDSMSYEPTSISRQPPRHSPQGRRRGRYRDSFGCSRCRCRCGMRTRLMHLLRWPQGRRWRWRSSGKCSRLTARTHSRRSRPSPGLRVMMSSWRRRHNRHHTPTCTPPACQMSWQRTRRPDGDVCVNVFFSLKKNSSVNILYVIIYVLTNEPVRSCFQSNHQSPRSCRGWGHRKPSAGPRDQKGGRRPLQHAIRSWRSMQMPSKSRSVPDL